MQRRSRPTLAAWALLALLLAAAGTARAAAAAAPPPPDSADEQAAVAVASLDAADDVSSEQLSDDEEAEMQEEQYQQAMAIRDRTDASQRDLKHAAKLLFAAAGIQHLSLERPQQVGSSSGAGGSSSSGAGGSSSGGQPEYLTSDAVKLVLRQDRPTHLGALKELVYAYREGGGVSMNPAVAHRLVRLLAELGHPESQADLGFHLALGIEPVAPNSRDQLFRLVPPDPPAALVHYSFAAQAGDPVGQLSLGYRHLHGLGVPKSCQSAVLYYTPVAEKVLELAQQAEGLPHISNVKLSYRAAGAKRLSEQQEALHYQWFADFGNVDAAREAARLLAHGATRDYGAALRYLNQAAAAGDSTAMAHLGNMYSNGLGVQQNNKTAVDWYRRAVEHGHPAGHLALGYMYMAGSHGLDKSFHRAIKHLKDAVAAGQAISGGGRQWSGLGDAYFYLGQMHLRGWGTKPDAGQAAKLWEASARLMDARHTFDAASSPKSGALLAAYNLAMLHLGGHTGERRPCEVAAGLLKRVAEKGWPAQQEANEDWNAGDYEWALLNYLKASEMGVAVAQANAAWMLTDGYGYEGPEAGRVALLLYRRAAQQGDHSALLRIGDSYWYGKGVGRDWRRAAQMYHEAAKHRDASGAVQGQALFNLGFMHQFGAGVPRDHHLAKRQYDSAGKARDSKYAVELALAFLRLHGWWEGVAPRLPPSVAAPVNALLFTLRDPSGKGPEAGATAAERHPSLTGRSGFWARVRRVVTLDFIFDALDELLEGGDKVDLAVASALLLLLALVLWRRRMLRLHRQQHQFVVATPGAAAAAAAAAAAVQQQQQQWEQPQWEPPAPAAAAEVAPAAAARAEPAVAPAADEASGSGGGVPAAAQEQEQQDPWHPNLGSDSD